jgi:hypothetical protein
MPSTRQAFLLAVAVLSSVSGFILTMMVLETTQQTLPSPAAAPVMSRVPVMEHHSLFPLFRSKKNGGAGPRLPNMHSEEGSLEDREHHVTEEEAWEIDENDPCHDMEYRSSHKIYKVGLRKDYQGSISDGLHALSLCKQSTELEPYDFYWDKTFDQVALDTNVKEKDLYNDFMLNPGAIVSSVPGFRETLGVKPSLARLHRACLKNMRSRDMCSFTKRAFNFERRGKKLFVEGGVSNFIDYAHGLTKIEKSQAEWPQLWIFKPQESFLGQGIRLMKVEEEDVKNRDGIAGWAARKFPDGKWTLQE